MKIALVADLHGNLPATMAVDADIRARGADAVWCLGDLVGKGPSSAETFDWAVNRCDVILRGNWDEGVALRQFKKMTPIISISSATGGCGCWGNSPWSIAACFRAGGCGCSTAGP